MTNISWKISISINFVIQNIIFTFAPLFCSVILKFENQYIIHFKGLKEGIHEFEFNITKPFFEDYNNLDIPEGNIEVQVNLTKKVNFMELDIELTGEIQVQCDRCLGNLNLPVSCQGHLLVRFSEAINDTEDGIIVLHPEEYLLDLKHYLYESISLTIPIRKVHPGLPGEETGCDPEMFKRLKEHLIIDN